uniref:Uncharacterized protein n=1 Tax=Anguilla anguilla TaxID=7936 RepID=A0A0E9RJA7_ANGAN
MSVSMSSAYLCVFSYAAIEKDSSTVTYFENLQSGADPEFAQYCCTSRGRCVVTSLPGRK